PPTHRPTRAILPPSPSLIRFIYLITLPRAPRSPLFPYTTLFRSDPQRAAALRPLVCIGALLLGLAAACTPARPRPRGADVPRPEDRKSTRLNSSHVKISYAVFCSKKKKKKYVCIPSKLHDCRNER